MKKKWMPHIAAVTALVVFVMLGLASANTPEASSSEPQAPQAKQEAPPPYNSESDFKIDWDTNVKDGIVITEYTGTRKEVNIPPTIQNQPVTSIGERAFHYNKNITSIIIPDSVVTIVDGSAGLGRTGAFSDCTSLTSVTIGNSVTNIGVAAFADCTRLARVTIPDSVTSIGVEAFAKSGLTSVTIPSSVTRIGDAAFSNCSKLTSVTIPDSITTIGNEMFASCTSLARITIPNSVTSIGHGAFSGTGLTSVTIPDSVVTLVDGSAGLGRAGAFSGCANLTSVTIGNGVTRIGYDAFSKCTKLTSVTIGNSVPSIGAAAFDGCTSLTSVTIPSSVTSIGYGAFNDTSLTSVTFQGTIPANRFDDQRYWYTTFPGDLRAKYLANDGGPGTYTRFANGDVWRKQ